jgi:type IX secretion system PorP/SprF family membrane protein
MQQLKSLIYLFIVTCCSISLIAQTHYSSQSFNGINFYNPANVGFGTNNKFKSFYRTQFEGVGNPYRTIGVGIDLGLFKTNQNFNKNIFGMGLNAVSEQVMGGLLQINYITFSLANRIYLNDNKTNFLSLGISATVIARTIDAERLTFGDQYNSGRLFNATSIENIKSIPVKISNNGGVMYTSLSEKSYLQIGASLFYINSSSDNQVIENIDQAYQYIGMLSFEKLLWNDNTLLFYTDYQKRVENEYYYGGVALGLPVNNSKGGMNRLYLGCFYRAKDAIIPYFGLMNSKFKIGLTYDIYQKNMSLSNLKPQTLEFTLSSYLGRRSTELFRSLFD